MRTGLQDRYILASEEADRRDSKQREKLDALTSEFERQKRLPEAKRLFELAVEMNRSEEPLAVLLAVEAMRVAILPEAEQMLRRKVQRTEWAYFGGAPPHQVAIASDAKWLICSGRYEGSKFHEDAISLYDLKDRTRVGTLLNGTNIDSFVRSSDGGYLTAKSKHNCVYIVTVPHGTLVAEIQPPGASVLHAICLGPGAAFLAISLTDRSVAHWEHTYDLPNLSDLIDRGCRLATCYPEYMKDHTKVDVEISESHRVLVYSVATAQLVSSLSHDSAMRVKFSNDGRRMLITSRGELDQSRTEYRIFDLAEDGSELNLNAGPVSFSAVELLGEIWRRFCGCVSPDGRWRAEYCDGSVSAFETATGNEVAVLPCGEPYLLYDEPIEVAAATAYGGPFFGCAFDGDSEHLGSAGGYRLTVRRRSFSREVLLQEAEACAGRALTVEERKRFLIQ